MLPAGYNKRHLSERIKAQKHPRYVLGAMRLRKSARGIVCALRTNVA